MKNEKETTADPSGSRVVTSPRFLDAWMQEYSKHLAECVRSMPEQYGYSVEQVPAVCGRMQAAFIRDSYNHDSPAIKRTCKAFGIPHTRKAIRVLLSGGAK